MIKFNNRETAFKIAEELTSNGFKPRTEDIADALMIMAQRKDEWFESLVTDVAGEYGDDYDVKVRIGVRECARAVIERLTGDKHRF